MRRGRQSEHAVGAPFDPRRFGPWWQLAPMYVLGACWIALCLPVVVPMYAYQTWRDRRRYARRD